MDTFVPCDELRGLQNGLKYNACVASLGFLLALANLSIGAYLLGVVDHTEGHVDQILAILGNGTAAPQ